MDETALQRTTRIAMCAGKRRYKRYQDAETARKHMRRTSGIREALESYKCTKCHDWHIGGLAEGELYKRRQYRREKAQVDTDDGDGEETTGRPQAGSRVGPHQKLGQEN